MLTLKGRLEARGLRVVGVSRAEADDVPGERAEVEKAAAEEKMTYPTVLDVGGAWQRAAGVKGVPEFLVVGRDGRVALHHRGKLVEGSDAYAKVASALEAALGPDKP